MSAAIFPSQRALLERYLDELYRWNDRINLTTVPREQAWRRHIEESASLLRAAPPPENGAVVDIGSGAGVPGIPMAVLRPDLLITLIDSDVRKAGFLTHLAGLLALDNVEVAGVRAEQAARDPVRREAFDVAVSRATAAPAALCELALPLVRIGGHLGALVAGAEEAVAECHAAAQLCGGGAPFAAGPQILVVPKRGPTPTAYPRRPGVPTRRPLISRERPPGGRESLSQQPRARPRADCPGR